MSFKIQNIFLQEQPLFLNQNEMLKILPTPILKKIETELKLQFHHVGVEHSRYVNNELKKNNLSVQEILQNKNRFKIKSNIKNYFDINYKFGAAAAYRWSKDKNNYFGHNVNLFDIRTFIGKKNYKSSLHFDWNMGANLLFNLKGSKSLLLYPPNLSKDLGDYNIFSFKKINTQIKIDLDEMTGVLIPACWWHQADYKSDSVSVAFRIQPELTHLRAMKLLYPTWKYIQLYSNSKRDVKKLFSKIELSKFKYQDIESFFNESLDHKSKFDHIFYDKWNKGFLNC